MLTADINYALPTEERARIDYIDPARMNVRFTPATVALHDARDVNADLDLDVQGFRLFTHPSPLAASGTKGELEDAYHADMARFVQDLSGAREVRPQRSGLYIRGGKRIGDADNYRPLCLAHMDYTENSKAEFLKLSAEDDGPVTPYSRVAIYQTWRIVSPPPHRSLLTVADPRTVLDSDTFQVETVVGPEEFASCFFEGRLCEFNPQQKWYYFRDMRPEEVLVFKGYDSDEKKCCSVPHSSFDNPEAPSDAPPRESVEARFFAFFD